MNTTNRTHRNLSQTDGVISLQVALPAALREDAFFRSQDFREELTSFIVERLASEDVLLLRARALNRGDAALRAKMGLPTRESSSSRRGGREKTKVASSASVPAGEVPRDAVSGNPPAGQRDLKAPAAKQPPIESQPISSQAKASEVAAAQAAPKAAGQPNPTPAASPNIPSQTDGAPAGASSGVRKAGV